jgi:hypothetical protein
VVVPAQGRRTVVDSRLGARGKEEARACLLKRPSCLAVRARQRRMEDACELVAFAASVLPVGPVVYRARNASSSRCNA